uniref:Coiled-coil domain containing 97 n=1 Tax=Cyprinus carpio TaxID=7962 RepID=A0A8C2J1J5_CYPCA
MNLLLKAHNTRSSSPNQKVRCHLCPAHVCSLKHDSNHAALACFPQDEPFSCLSSMIEAIAASGSPVKSQQLRDPDLTLEALSEHTEAFSHLSSDFRVQYYCKEIQRRTSSTADRKRVRNHRYCSSQGCCFFLKHQIQFFQIRLLPLKLTLPLLYEQYIRQYLSEEILQRSEEAMRSGPGGLTDLLINSNQERLIQNRLEEEQEREHCAAEESETDRQTEWEPNAEEKAMLREEFLSPMHQRFLDGKDDFNYSEVDENPDYDNLNILSCDAEERYFDEEVEKEADMI